MPEDDGVLQPGDSLETDDLSSDPLDTGLSPPERHPASERFGVTIAEARQGESLDQRLAQEEPEAGAHPEQSEQAEQAEEDESGPRDVAEAPPVEGGDSAEPRAGRLVAPDEGDHAVDEPAYLARDVGVDGGAAGAEEAAVHVVEAADEEAGAGAGASTSATPD